MCATVAFDGVAQGDSVHAEWKGRDMNQIVQMRSHAPHHPEQSTAEIAKRVNGLTVNQRNVLCMMADNKSDEDIARQLQISGKGVEWYKTEIFRKLNLRYGDKSAGSLRKRNTQAIDALREWQRRNLIESTIKGKFVELEALSPYAPDYIERVRALTAAGYVLEQVVEIFVLRKK